MASILNSKQKGVNIIPLFKSEKFHATLKVI